MVDATAGHELLSFMDAYLGYIQIPMFHRDEEHTAFITDRRVYCYKVMPFDLKNAGATYQRLVNKIFAKLLEVSMEVYIDDMLVKSAVARDYVTHLDQTFSILRQTNMMLNPSKCTFVVRVGKFLGFIVSQRGTEANREKIQTIFDMGPPQRGKEVQKVTECIAALNRFVSRSIDKCLLFFNILRGSKEFAWTKECE